MTELNSPESFSDDANQKKLVASYIETIEAHGFLMNRNVDLVKMEEAVDHAAQLIGPLRTSELTPENYYSIYHVATTSLFAFANGIADRSKIDNRQIAEMYEICQYKMECLTRLYLMIVIGKELAVRGVVRITDMLEDLMQMTRGAQDPIRALFLRHFFVSIFKQALPDSTPQEMEKSLLFLLNNFASMNRMWVRIANIMANDERRAERARLSVLLGMNIQSISSLHGMSVEVYSHAVLPFLAKHVELCEDDMAQGFILETLVHAFPEDYHIATIDKLFSIFGRVEEGVRVLSIVNQLLDRFLSYIGGLIDPEQGRLVFVTIAKNIEELFNAEGNLALTDKFETLEKLLRFALRMSPDDVRNIRNLMKFIEFNIQLAIGEEPLTDKNASEKLRLFLECPLASLSSGEFLYELEYLPVLIDRLVDEDKKILATKICDLMIRSNAVIADLDQLKFFLSTTVSLVINSPGKSCFFACFHLINGGSIMYTTALLQELANGMQKTCPGAAERAILPIGFCVMKMMVDEEIEEDELKKLMQFIVVYGESTAETSPQATLMLFAEASKVFDALEFRTQSSKLLQQAILLLSDIEKPAVKARMLNYLLQVVLASRFVDLSCNSELCNCAASLTPATKQISALVNCSSLFWRADEREQTATTVQACLSKASKIAATASEEGQAAVLHGFYQILGAVAMWLKEGVDLNGSWVNALISLIGEKHQAITEKGMTLEGVVGKDQKVFYQNTAIFMRDNNLLTEGDDGDEGEDEGEGEEEDQ